VDVSLLEVVDDDEEPEVVEDPEGPSMSVVSGGLVLVIVWVVVAVPDCDAVAEYVGSTKSMGACSVSPNSRATAIAAKIRMPTTTSAIRLAPTTADVRLCQGCPSSSSFRPATATDGIRDLHVLACSAELRDHLCREEVHVIEVRHIKYLQVHPLHAELQVGAELVGDLRRRPHQWGVAA
jgi:hypothetical protein